jgi:signal transduction histidine kinase
LGVIRGYLRLLAQTGSELSERSRETVAATLRATDRIAEVLDEASLFAHLNLGDIALEMRRVPLAAVVHAAIQAAVLPNESQVDLDAATLPQVFVEADEARLRSALATLIMIVARAQSSSVIVEIRGAPARVGGRPGVRLRIGPRTLSGVQASAVALNTARGGFGLAIPIAAVVVEGHGGRVRELRHGDRSAGLVVTLPVV